MIPYILHVALLISICLLFYKVLLQKETFYRLNRVVLMFCLALSFVLPLIPVPQQWSLRESVKADEVKAQQLAANQQTANVLQDVTVKTQPIIKANPVKHESIAPVRAGQVSPVKAVQPAPVAKAPAALSPAVPFMQTAFKWLFYLYWIGVAAFGLNLLLQIVVLLFQAYTKPFIKDGKFRIIELTGDKAPCSFGNNIFINPEKYDWDTYSQILLHEKIHIQQRHSLDIIIAELVLVLQWFNPFAWLYRTELENNLEFLTDESVLGHKEVERSSYQLSLLKVSAPHLSLGITTNYNQSLLKKRILMMNSKRSNIHTMWKYFFLVPLLGGLACALNSPLAYSKNIKPENNLTLNIKVNPVITPNIKFHFNNDETEGVWFATIKGEKMHIEFKSDDDDHHWSSSSTFKVSEFSALPKEQKGEFTLKRGAGTAVCTGRFQGNEGYGHYKFTADKDFTQFLTRQGIAEIEDGDSFAFFVMNVTKDYVDMLHKSGYKNLSKNDLISMAALKVDEPYIKMWKENGYADLTPNELVSGKALGITSEYVDEIRKAGYKDLSFNDLISFKAQHITGAYINSLKKAKLREGNGDGADNMPSAGELSSYKAMNIDSNYVHALAMAGYKNLPYNKLTEMKALGITPAYINSFKAMGYTHLTVDNLSTLKSLGITPAYIKNYQAMGFKDLTVNDLSTLKSLGITGDYIKSFEAMGYKNLTINQLSSLKSMGITPETIRKYQAMGFKNLTVNNLTGLKAMGISEEFIKSFDELGYKGLSANQLSELKSMGITPDYVCSFEAIGYKNLSVNNLSSLKSLDITPDYIKGFKDLGFKDISVNELTSLKATGVTPEYVSEMRGKGFKSDDVEKYIRLKSAFN